VTTASACWPRIRRLAVAAEVLEYPVNDRGFLNAGNDLELPAAAPSDLDVDRKNPLQTLCPGQTPLPVDGRWLARLQRLIGRSSARSRHDARPVRARRREHAVDAVEHG